MKQHFINNRWVSPASGESIPVIDPSDGQVFETIARGNTADIDQAVSAARAAYEGEWGRLNAVERGRLMQKLAQTMSDHAEELAQIEARDCGKPLKQARADAAACARYFEFYGGAADKLHGETIPYQPGYTVLTFREPHGVTGPHHSVELPDADLRPQRRRGARRRQRLRGQAGRGRLPVAAAHRRAGRRSRAFPPARSTSSPGYGDEAGAALARIPASTTSRSPARPPSARWSRRPRRQPHTRSRWSWAASRRRSSSPTPTSTPRCR